MAGMPRPHRRFRCRSSAILLWHAEIRTIQVTDLMDPWNGDQPSQGSIDWRHLSRHGAQKPEPCTKQEIQAGEFVFLHERPPVSTDSRPSSCVAWTLVCAQENTECDFKEDSFTLRIKLSEAKILQLQARDLDSFFHAFENAFKPSFGRMLHSRRLVKPSSAKVCRAQQLQNQLKRRALSVGSIMKHILEAYVGSISLLIATLI